MDDATWIVEGTGLDGVVDKLVRYAASGLRWASVNLVPVTEVEAHRQCRSYRMKPSNPFTPPAREGCPSGDAEVSLL